jgi:CRISPR-associated protein Csb3
MTAPKPSFRVRVDVTNPGQFFACCGLLELASKLSQAAVGWFEQGVFFVSQSPELPQLLKAITDAGLQQLDSEDATASPIQISAPFNVRLDWWKTSDRAISDLKLWAGRMESFRIARAMQLAMRAPGFASENLLNIGTVVYEPEEPDKKVEPFYFDARRGPNAHSRDVGFAPNDLGLTTIASPSVEFLCLVGLQRTKPVPVPKSPRIFDYHVWTKPMPVTLTPAAVAGFLPDSAPHGYRFESWFRTGQRKHKAFLSAKPKPQSQIL